MCCTPPVQEYLRGSSFGRAPEDCSLWRSLTEIAKLEIFANHLKCLAPRAGLLDPGPIQEKWAEHQSGKRNWQHFMWNVLMFEAWRRAQSPAS